MMSISRYKIYPPNIIYLQWTKDRDGFDTRLQVKLMFEDISIHIEVEI
jgi:hypothetical protein